MILTLILVTVSLSSISSLALIAANPEYSRALRGIHKRYEISGISVGCLLAVFGFALLGLWTWLAFDQHDWRFAAIAWIPFLCKTLGRVATNPKRTAVRS